MLPGHYTIIWNRTKSELNHIVISDCRKYILTQDRWVTNQARVVILTFKIELVMQALYSEIPGITCCFTINYSNNSSYWNIVIQASYNLTFFQTIMKSHYISSDSPIKLVNFIFDSLHLLFANKWWISLWYIYTTIF